VPPVWLLVRNSPEAAGVAGEPEPTGAAARLEHDVPDWQTAGLLRNRPFWLLILAFTPLVTAFGAAQQNLAPFTSDHGIEPQEAAYLVSLMALVMAGAKVVFGALADRWDLRWLFFLTVAILLGAFALMTGEVGYTRMVLVCAMLGAASGGFLPLLASAISTRFGVAAFGQVMGMVGPFTTLAALGPWFAGYVRDSTGSYDAAWFFLAMLLIPALAAMAVLRPAPRPTTA
jgi:cyanate permease